MDFIKRQPSFNLHNKRLGTFGEELSTQWLKQHGFEIIERNFRNRFGEIDIIASKNKVIYCIEVKTRSNTNFGNPVDAITSKKLHRMKMVAVLYEQKRKLKLPIRLCVMEVLKQNCNLLEVE